MRNDKELHKAILAVMLGKKEEPVSEAKKPLHPNQQKLDVHEPEKDELTAHDFKKLRSGKKPAEMEEALSGKAAQQAAVAISLIKAGKKDGKMPKNEEVEQVKEASGYAISSVHHFPDKTMAVKVKDEDSDIEHNHVGSPSHLNNTLKSRYKINHRLVWDSNRVKKYTNEELVFEETEQVDELHRDTISSYVQKASDARLHKNMSTAKVDKRNSGVSKAIQRLDKMNNEEVSLDEAVHVLHPSKDEPVHITDIKNKSDFHKKWDKEPMSHHKEYGYDSPIVNVKTHLDLKGKPVHKMTYSQYSSLVGKRAASGKNFSESKDGKMPKNEEIDMDEADETVIVNTPVEFDLQEKYSFGEYLSAAKNMVGEEEAINIANEAFRTQDLSIFMENFMRSDIEDKVKVHQTAGHKVSMPKYMTKSGKPYAEYMVTDKESGVRRKYIHHGNARSVENMGGAGKKD